MTAAAAGLDIADSLQALGAKRATGTLYCSSDDAVGRVGLIHGRISGTEFRSGTASLDGEDALDAMLNEPFPGVRFVPGEAPDDQDDIPTVEVTAALLASALRRDTANPGDVIVAFPAEESQVRARAPRPGKPTLLDLRTRAGCILSFHHMGEQIGVTCAGDPSICATILRGAGSAGAIRGGGSADILPSDRLRIGPVTIEVLKASDTQLLDYIIGPQGGAA